MITGASSYSEKPLPLSGINRINICSGFLFRGEVMDMDKRKLSDNELNKVAAIR
jgi:hypothetical protein